MSCKLFMLELWQNMIACVRPVITPENQKVCEIISVASKHENVKTKQERAAKYKEKINKRPDVIESDILTEV